MNQQIADMESLLTAIARLCGVSTSRVARVLIDNNIRTVAAYYALTHMERVYIIYLCESK